MTIDTTAATRIQELLDRRPPKVSLAFDRLSLESVEQELAKWTPEPLGYRDSEALLRPIENGIWEDAAKCTLEDVLGHQVTPIKNFLTEHYGNK